MWTMYNPKSCESGDIDDEKTEAWEDPEWDDCKSRDRGHVDALLDISEEHSFKEQEPYEVQSQAGWEEAVQGWGWSDPLACFFQAQRKGKKVRLDGDSHCLLCADLKDVKLSEFLASGCAGTSSELSCQAPEEPLKNTVPTSVELPPETPRSSSSCSCSILEKEASDISVIEGKSSRTDTLGLKPMFEGEQLHYMHNQTLPHHLQPKVQCPFLNARGAGKVALISTLLVLPPVKPTTPVNSRNSMLSKRREALGSKVGEDTGPLAFAQKDVPYCSSAVDSCHRALTSIYDSTQHQYHLLSFPVSKKSPMPFSTLDEALPRTSSILARGLRHEELTRLPLRHSSGLRAHSGFKPKNMKRAEPELPLLLGTRVAIPVSAQRLL